MGGTKTSSRSEPLAESSEFNELQFERTLTTLKDSQESINSCCQWCLANRQNHKRIVNSWLNVLKRVKVEQRLVLFYLANDVVQYSKRRNYEYVESWGTALQKATTMVRDERVKHKILRIFKIWEQRGVYSEDVISDLCGLISVTPTGSKSDDPHEFQANYVVNKIKNCANLEKDTDSKLKVLKEHNPKIQIDEGLITSLKDRAHVDDVEKELETYVKHMENYVNALKLEIKNRITLISVLKQAETQLEADRKDVKMVAHAYKMFGQRVKTFQKKLLEKMEDLPSPIPSPDINAPSPSPDSDLELPEDDTSTKLNTDISTNNSSISKIFTNPGYYNPVAALQASQNSSESNNYLSNGFSSFMGNDIPFDLQNLSSSSLFGSNVPSGDTQQTPQTPLPVESPWATGTGHSLPLQPPPMPPFTKSETGTVYGNNGYSDAVTTNSYGSSFTSTTSAYDASTAYNPSNPTFDPSDIFEPPEGANPYPPTEADGAFGSLEGSNPFAPVEQYNPEDDWSGKDRQSWAQPVQLDTPESPPHFEREGYVDPVEYHDEIESAAAADVDHRMLPAMGDLDDSLGSLGGKDVDHRNLISLTGSPLTANLQVQNDNSQEWNNADQDYRQLTAAPPPPPPDPPAPLPATPVADQDYRLPFPAIPPPPPLPDDRPPLPPPDNVDNIDMDLSDEVDAAAGDIHLSLEPPPPLPDLPDDDCDANNFLDEIVNDMSGFVALAKQPPPPQQPIEWSHPPPPMVNFQFPPMMPPQPPWMQGFPPMPPPVPIDQSYIDENPYLHDDDDHEQVVVNQNNNFRGGRQNNNRGGFRGPRGGRGRGGGFRGRGGRGGGFRHKDFSNEVEAVAGDIHLSLKPPPPLPELPDDDCNSNNFLDDIVNDMSGFVDLAKRPPPPQ